MPSRPQGTDTFGISRPSNTLLALIGANVAAYVLYLLLLRGGGAGLAAVLPFTPADFIGRLYLWQPFTATLLHSPMDPGHLLMNCLFLWIFGGELQSLRGAQGLLRIYAVTGLAGWLAVLGVAAVGLALGSPGLWETPHLGASGAVMGVTGAWGGILWGQVRHFLFLGPMRVRTFLLLLVGIELLGALSLAGGTSWWAHLGGLGAGLAVGRGLVDPRSWVLRWRRRRIRAELAELEQKKAKFGVILGGRGQKDEPYEH